MTTIKDIIVQTDFESVAQEVKIHYGCEHFSSSISALYLLLEKYTSPLFHQNLFEH